MTAFASCRLPGPSANLLDTEINGERSQVRGAFAAPSGGVDGLASLDLILAGRFVQRSPYTSEAYTGLANPSFLAVKEALAAVEPSARVRLIVERKLSEFVEAQGETIDTDFERLLRGVTFSLISSDCPATTVDPGPVADTIQIGYVSAPATIALCTSFDQLAEVDRAAAFLHLLFALKFTNNTAITQLVGILFDPEYAATSADTMANLARTIGLLNETNSLQNNFEIYGPNESGNVMLRVRRGVEGGGTLITSINPKPTADDPRMQRIYFSGEPMSYMDSATRCIYMPQYFGIGNWNLPSLEQADMLRRHGVARINGFSGKIWVSDYPPVVYDLRTGEIAPPTSADRTEMPADSLCLRETRGTCLWTATTTDPADVEAVCDLAAVCEDDRAIYWGDIDVKPHPPTITATKEGQPVELNYVPSRYVFEVPQAQCQNSTGELVVRYSQEPAFGPLLGAVTGTVERINWNACTFVIKLDAPLPCCRYIEPIGLSEDWRVHGRRISFKYEVARDAFTPCNLGLVARVSEIESTP